MLNSLIERFKPNDVLEETIEVQGEIIEFLEQKIELREDLIRSLESQISSHKDFFNLLGCPLDKMMDALETTGRFEPEDELPVLTMTRTVH